MCNKSQGSYSKAPSHAFDSKEKDILLHTVKKDIASFLYSSQSFVKDFVLKTTDKKSITLLLAVSGGVDSQVMLHCLHTLKDFFGYELTVVTVNHNIRSFDESKADADIVFTYCKNTLKIPCEIITIEPGTVAALATKRDRGIEEAARFIRYTNIRKHAKKVHADVVLFAHNKDDHLETLVLHFLQGSSAGVSGFASSGIRQISTFPNYDESDIDDKSLVLFRPLLRVSRKYIESYATMNKVPYRDDSSNTDIAYYRNRIRHKLIPVLDEWFNGWQTGVVSGSEKAYQESLFVNSFANSLEWQKINTGVKIRCKDFFSQGYPVRVRLLYRGFELAGLKAKISYNIIKACSEGQRYIEYAGLEVFQNNGYLIIRKKEIVPEDFLLDIAICGVYKTQYGSFEIKPIVEKNTFFADTESGYYYLGEFNLPLRIRSKKPGEVILTAQGCHKSVKKIFSEWRVDVQHRPLIPVVEHKGEAIGIFGSLYGYKNWIVKQNYTEQDKVSVQFIRNN